MAEKKLSKTEQLNNELVEIEISQKKRRIDIELSSVKQEDLRRAIEVSTCALGRFPGLAGVVDIGESKKVLVDLLVSAVKKLQAEID